MAGRQQTNDGTAWRRCVAIDAREGVCRRKIKVYVRGGACYTHEARRSQGLLHAGSKIFSEGRQPPAWITVDECCHRIYGINKSVRI
jgi:hypothetical protein